MRSGWMWSGSLWSGWMPSGTCGAVAAWCMAAGLCLAQVPEVRRIVARVGSDELGQKPLVVMLDSMG